MRTAAKPEGHPLYQIRLETPSGLRIAYITTIFGAGYQAWLFDGHVYYSLAGGLRDESQARSAARKYHRTNYGKWPATKAAMHWESYTP
jgi:hypothetical protein